MLITMSLVERARALASELPAHRAAHDSARRLEPVVVAALREGGFLSCLLPTELGGAELAPATYVEMLEALAFGDSATAWCVMTASTSTLLAPYLPKATASAIWGGPVPFLSGVFAPSGKLDETSHLAGKWSYMSGAHHADWFVVGALAGRRHVVCFVPPSAARIVDNWDTLGLAGTGSHDLLIEGARVEAAHVTSVFDQAPWTTTPLYRMPLFGLLAVGIAACGLGIARAALGHAIGHWTAETPSGLLARYADLRAQLDAARAYLLASCTSTFARAQDGAIDAAGRGELRLAASHVAARCTEVVRGAFHTAGGAGVRTGHPLGAALRDAETLLTHRMVSDRVLPAAARAVLGLGTPPPDL